MITEGILGVVTGLIGTITTNVLNLKAQRLKNEHELAMVKAQTAAMIEEAAANIKITEAQVAGEIERIESQAYLENIKSANTPVLDNAQVSSMYANKWTRPFAVIITMAMAFVEFLRGFMRPGLTAYLVGLTSWLTWESVKVLQSKQEWISSDTAVAMFDNVTNIIIYLTVSVVTWWFGDRRVAKFLYRLNDGNLREK